MRLMFADDLGFIRCKFNGNQVEVSFETYVS